MKINTLTLSDPCYPETLRNIPDPPKLIHSIGDSFLDLLEKPRITVIGSRKATAYGQTVTAQLAADLARAGVIIISGLALGIDSLAHKAALEAHTPTIAVLPAGFDRIYPASHKALAERIVEQGGALVTEYNPGAPLYKTNFLARNRIASALGQGVLITEAAERSGTLSTAHHALDQGREVFAVPGNITSPTSTGTNNLIKAGATPATSASDILYALGLEPIPTGTATSDNPDEQTILTLLQSGVCDSTQLLEGSQLTVSRFNQSLTMLEINGLIRPLGNNQWRLV